MVGSQRPSLPVQPNLPLQSPLRNSFTSNINIPQPNIPQSNIPQPNISRP